MNWNIHIKATLDETMDEVLCDKHLKDHLKRYGEKTVREWATIEPTESPCEDCVQDAAEKPDQ